MKKITFPIILTFFVLAFGLSLIACPKVFASTNDYLDFSKKNLSDVSALSNVDFSTAKTVDFSNNLFDNNDLADLIQLANTYKNADFILFFNNITIANNYPSNMFLGAQNIESVYLNQTPDSRYTIFNDYNSQFEFNVSFVERLDGFTTFSNSFGNDTFNQTGKYRIKFYNNERAYYKDLSYCYAYVTSPQIRCEMGANIALNNIEIRGGLNIANFYVEITHSDGQPFSTNKLGTFDIVYNIYAKSVSGSKLGSVLTTLTQTVTFYDTTGPVITPNEVYSYCYLFTPYTDSGATAVDVVDGECTISSTTNINIQKIGVYEITYIAEDKSGNKSQLTKNIEVIYRPLESISLVYDAKEHYFYGETVDFEIVINNGQAVNFTNPQHTFYVFQNGSLILETTSQHFSLKCEEFGNNHLLVLTEDKLNTGNTGRTSTQVEIAVFEGLWWDNVYMKLFLFLILLLAALDVIIVISAKITREKKIAYNTTRK